MTCWVLITLQGKDKVSVDMVLEDMELDILDRNQLTSNGMSCSLTSAQNSLTLRLR